MFSPPSRLSYTSFIKNQSLLHRFRTFSTTPSSTSPFPTSIASLAEKHPFLIQCTVSVIKTSLADIMTQTVAERKKLSEVDWKRNGVFICFGAVYLGGFQYFLMVNRFAKWFPLSKAFSVKSLSEKVKDVPGMIEVVKMVAFDLMIHLPIMYFPSFYTLKEILTSPSYSPLEIIPSALSKYKANCTEDVIAAIKLWGPSGVVQFSLPPATRMIFRHFVSFFWTAYVSFTRGKIDVVQVDGDLGGVVGEE